MEKLIRKLVLRNFSYFKNYAKLMPQFVCELTWIITSFRTGKLLICTFNFPNYHFSYALAISPDLISTKSLQLQFPCIYPVGNFHKSPSIRHGHTQKKQLVIRNFCILSRVAQRGSKSIPRKMFGLRDAKLSTR